MIGREEEENIEAHKTKLLLGKIVLSGMPVGGVVNTIIQTHNGKKQSTFLSLWKVGNLIPANSIQMKKLVIPQMIYNIGLFQ